MQSAIALSTNYSLSATDFLSSLEIKKAGGKFICPGCNQEVVPRSRPRWSNHFYHKVGRDCKTFRHQPETEEHKQGKQIIAQWLKMVFAGFDIEVNLEKAVSSRRPDIVLSTQGNILLVAECQVSWISRASIDARTRDLNKAGVNVLWFLGDKVKARLGHHFEREQGQWHCLDFLHCYFPKNMQTLTLNGSSTAVPASLFNSNPLYRAVEKLGENNFRQLLAGQFCQNFTNLQPENLTQEMLQDVSQLAEALLALSPLPPVPEPVAPQSFSSEVLSTVPYDYNTKKFDKLLLQCLREQPRNRKKTREYISSRYEFKADDLRMYLSERDQQLNQGVPKLLWQRGVDIRFDSLVNLEWIKPIEDGRAKGRSYEVTELGLVELERLQNL